MRRWRLTSAATADSASDQRSGIFICWRGSAAGLGGWTFVTRLSLVTLQATGMAAYSTASDRLFQQHPTGCSTGIRPVGGGGLRQDLHR
jgi:hypothetical protein